jgi:hypothetical protein
LSSSGEAKQQAINEKITNLVQQGLHHFLKQMEPYFMVIKETVEVVEKKL